jgi:hypothetical protein
MLKDSLLEFFSKQNRSHTYSETWSTEA